MHRIHRNQTAVLIFANSSREELKHKLMTHGLELFDALTAATISTVKKSKLPYFHFSEENQIGTTFGERFSNAIQAIFDKGYEHVITIGNDAPQLKVSHLLKARCELQRKKIVLGPSTDGGFYLLGLHKSQFNRSHFTKLAWQTSKITRDLISLVSKQNTNIVFLDRLFDIDSVKDIKAIIAFNWPIPKTILVALLQILKQKIEIPCYISEKPITFSCYKLQNRGSPLPLPQS